MAVRFPVLVLVAGLLGCRATPEPPPPPSIAVQIAPYAGGVFEGPLPGRAETVSDDPAEALVVDYQVFSVAALPDVPLEPISQRTRLAFTSPSPNLLTPAAMLARGALVATGDAAGRLLESLGSTANGPDDVVERGATVLLEHATLRIAVAPPVPGDIEQLALMVGRENEDAELTVVFSATGLTQVWSRSPPSQGLESPLYESREERRTEALVFDQQADPTAGPVAVAMRRSRDEPGYLIFSVAAKPAPKPTDDGWAAHAEKVAACHEQIVRAAREADRIASPLTSARRAEDVLADAAASLGDPDSRRAALAHLADEVQAPFTADLALLAADELIEAVVASATEGGALSEATLEEYGWTLERSSVLVCAGELKSSTLDTALSELVVLHFGEVGFFPSRLEDAAKGSGGLKEFMDRIVSLHIEYLDANNPATRVQAYDWLVLEGREVPGYDPFGDPKARRAALTAYDLEGARP
jgi:hypothetical protein